jgi:hypothetical protein
MGWKEVSNHEVYCGFMWFQHVSLFDIFAWDDDPNWHVADGWLKHQADHIYIYILPSYTSPPQAVNEAVLLAGSRE